MPTIRPYQNGDDEHVSSVIERVYKEYGFTFEPGGYNLDTYQIRSTYIDSGGAFWVMEDGGAVIGSVGLKYRSPSRVELYRLYLLSEFRGQGLGKALFEITQEWAREHGFTEMEIWSDKKLESAHAMYRKCGAESLGDRICDDPDNSEEWGFLLRL